MILKREYDWQLIGTRRIYSTRMKIRANGIYAKYIKRLLDVIVSLAVLIIFFWLYLILAILVKIKLGSPVLFQQERPGKDEKIFKMYKFRTMQDKRDEKGNLLPDSERLTMFGKRMRATSLDELPEMINILKGEMSLVGPRPLLVGYLPYYTDEEKKRHWVKPGLTGLAQVSGRNMISWDERLAKDVEYVDRISFIEDVKVLYMTIGAVIHHAGVAVDTSVNETNFARERQEATYK